MMEKKNGWGGDEGDNYVHYSRYGDSRTSLNHQLKLCVQHLVIM